MRSEKIPKQSYYRQVPVEKCKFSNRTCWALRRSDISNLYMLIHLYNTGELRNVKGIGKLGYAEIENYLCGRYLKNNSNFAGIDESEPE